LTAGSKRTPPFIRIPGVSPFKSDGFLVFLLAFFIEPLSS
jgi:hypothetical protein